MTVDYIEVVLTWCVTPVSPLLLLFCLFYLLHTSNYTESDHKCIYTVDDGIDYMDVVVLWCSVPPGALCFSYTVLLAASRASMKAPLFA